MPLVVFLRGVNVGGHKTFRPSILAGQLKKYEAVNLGAAGTFVIRRPVSRARLRQEIARRLPFVAGIYICTGKEILELMSTHPFGRQPAKSGVVRFVSVLPRRPRTEPSLPVSFPAGDRWLLRIVEQNGKFVIGLYRRHMKVIGYFSNLDRLFGAPVTTRNWNTFTAIAKALDARNM